MFKWYYNAGICYVHLMDVNMAYVNAIESRRTEGETRATTKEAESEGRSTFNTNSHGTLHNFMSQSRWFTRGWTLQELLAPAVVHFFDQAWRSIGQAFRHR